MDSKLKAAVVGMVAVMSLVILAIVVIVNRDKLTSGQPAKTQSILSNSGYSTDDSTSDGQSMSSGDDLTRFDIAKYKDDSHYLKWRDNIDFFDGEVGSLAAKLEEKMRTLSLCVESIQNDIRVCIKGYGGELVAGEAFEVVVREQVGNRLVNSFKDSNMDGIVYVDNLKAGEYKVSLNAIGDYILPDSVKVSVSDEVAYHKIGDISFFIREESDAVIMSYDDSRYFAPAFIPTDGEFTTEILQADNARFGVDLYSKNDGVDFKQLVDAGVSFVMLRAGYRGSESGELIADSKFREYARNASLAGLHVGAYWDSHAKSEYEAVEEASALIELCSPYIVDYPLALVPWNSEADGIDEGVDSVSDSTIDESSIANAFAQTISNYGAKPMIYQSSEPSNEFVNQSVLDGILWIRDFGPYPNTELNYRMWNYSPKGSLPGILGDVSMNLYFPDSQ